MADRMTNIVVIGNREKGIESYIFSILLRAQPNTYNNKNHKCIIIQVKNSLLDFAETIMNFFKLPGFFEEVSRTQKDFAVGGYILEGGWEIVLKKVHEEEKSLFDYVSERMK